MRRRLFLAGSGVALAQAPYKYYLTGNATDADTMTAPGYVLMGGGKDVDRAFEWLIRKSGGGDIVILRASGADGYNPYIAGLGRVDSIESLVIATPEAARDPFVLERIRKAEAIFLAGGDQWNYVHIWGPSPVRAAIQERIDRGVPVGGTSAGLAVLGQFVFTAEKDTVTSTQALADPYHERVTVGDELVHIPVLSGVITDSHFVKRDRMGRLLVFLARILQDGRAAEARAIAIDERTAVLAEPGGEAAVAGEGPAYFLRATAKPEVCRAGVPLTWPSVDVYRVNASGSFDLKRWTGRGGTHYRLSVKAGVVTSSASTIY